MKTVLLLGRLPFDLDVWRPLVAPFPVTLKTGTTITDVQAAFEAGPIAHVMMGAGLPLDQRLAIIQTVFASSDATTVHMKDRASGKDGMEAFVVNLLATL